MVSKATPASATPAPRSTIQSYFRFWPTFSMAGSSSTGRRALSVCCRSRNRSPGGPATGTYQASLSCHAKESPTISAQRGQRCVVSRSKEIDFCRPIWATSAARASGVSTT